MADETSSKAHDFLARISGVSHSELPSLIREGTERLLESRATLADTDKFRLEGAVKRRGEGARAQPGDTFALEAIIIPDKRPVELVRNGAFSFRSRDWEDLNSGSAYAHLSAALPSIGRVDLPYHPTLPYAGTAIVVGDGLMMTNRHVAEAFASGLGQNKLVFHPGQTADVDFLREYSNPASILVHVREVAMIHPYWDMALLRVEGLPPEQKPLVLSLQTPDQLLNQTIAVVGYPAPDPRNNRAIQDRVFNGVYYVKRIQPGKIGAGRPVPVGSIDSYGKPVSALIHDASTMGGNSGSPVIDPRSGHIVGLHFAGLYLDANYCVPMSELAKDARIIDAGVRFEGAPQPVSKIFAREWQAADPSETPEPASAASLSAGATMTIPLIVSVKLGDAAAQTSLSAISQPIVADPVVESMVEPIHEPVYDNRLGYDPAFLGVELPLPRVKDISTVAKLDDGSHIIPYHHFSLALHKERRLALFTAANVDLSREAKQPEPGKSYTRDGLSGLGKGDVERWFSDPRIPAIYQLPDVFFTKDKGAFDKGHLVRRDDVAWGRSFADIQAANGDTFHVTNCSPQVAGFNRSNHVDNWGELENFIAREAKDSRISIFAGPVLSENDRIFSGKDEKGATRVRIPSRYWKIVVTKEAGKLLSYAFILSQDLSSIKLEMAITPVWRQHMIAIAELERIIGLVAFPEQIKKGDQFSSKKGAALVDATSIARRPKGMVAGRTEHELAQGPLTFRDPMLSAFQSIAKSVAQADAGVTEGAMGAGSSASRIILEAEAVAQGLEPGSDVLMSRADQFTTEGPSLLSWAGMCTSLGFKLFKARHFGTDAEAKQYEDELVGGQCDPKWLSTVEVYLKTYGLAGDKAARQYVPPAKAGPAAIPMKAGAKIGLMGDWGTGARPARRLLELMKQQKPDILLHLGDIYYSGTHEECRDNFETIVNTTFNRATTHLPVYTLCGNHDMYCGGLGYYALIKRLNSGDMNQRASFFCLRAQDNSWQFLAMDTGRNDFNPRNVNDVVTFVEDDEIKWLRERVTEFSGKTVLLSHHQLFSAFAGIGPTNDDGSQIPHNPQLLNLFNTLKATGKSIPAWFWGHEHSQSIYKPYLNLPFGRCLGHGAIPVAEQDEPYKPLDGVKNLPTIIPRTKLSLKDGYYVNGFAMLTIHADQTMTAEYFEDRDGKAVRTFQETIA